VQLDFDAFFHITLSWSADGSSIHARAALPIAAGEAALNVKALL
jgi:hypothetical protein